MSFNKITIVGNLGRDPEIRYTPSGDAVCGFSVATTERKKDASGEAKDETTWFRVTTWRRQAEVANQYLRKGSQVYIEGRLRMNEFTDREGNKRASLEVTATDMQFIGAAPAPADSGASERTPSQPRSQAAAKKATASDALNDAGGDVNEDEIPF